MEKITLTEFIHTISFNDFQNDILLYNKEFDDFKEGASEMYKIDKMEDVFLFQKEFYEEFEVYLIFPIVAKYIYKKATDMDCSWCLDSKSINEKTKENFMKYLLELIVKSTKENE